MERITIIGLGFIGSSIGYALRLAKRKNREIVGFDSVSKVQQKAEKSGAVDRTEWGLPAAVTESDLVILAVPTLAIPDILENIAPHLKPGATVTDTTTNKREVIKWADKLLPRSVGFVGSHPLVSGSGVENARGDLFQSGQWAIVTTTYAPQDSVRDVVRLVEQLGAKPFFVGIDEHDSFVGAMTHLPIIISNALMLGVARSPSWREISQFASDDFRELSRLARVNPEVNLGAVVGNSDMVIHWIDQIMQELADFRAMLEDESRNDSEGPLMATFNDAWDARMRWEAGVSPVDIERPEMPTSSQTMMSLFMGDRGARRIREMMGRDDDRPRYGDRN